MRIKRCGFWILPVVIFFVLAFGGCGGHHRDDSEDFPGIPTPAPDPSAYRLQGTWIMRDGTGSAVTSTGGEAQLKVHQGVVAVTVKEINDDDSVIVGLQGDYSWDVYYGGVLSYYVRFYNENPVATVFTKTGENQYRYEFSNRNRVADIAILDDNTLFIQENGTTVINGLVNSYNMKYYMDRQTP
ncbi:MAG: hypothetical protein LBR61_12465 [Synergistaceae bacterium]|jgi:hypothetical protein|nr:hypothetical protein [Synergistaceae bacterium]